MDARDPFDSIAEHCRISSSQNERLCHRRFAGLPEEIEHDTDSQLSEEIEEELSGIMMVTPSSSSEDEENDCGTPKDNEIFQTPPENSQMASSNDGGDDRTIVVVEEEEEQQQQQQQQETEDEKAVDLGADTDLRFSEVELSQDSINEVMQSELKKIRVLKRELAASERLIESLKKKSKSSGNNLNSQSPKPCIKGTVEQIMKSLGKLNSNIDSPYHCGGKSLQTSQNSEATDKGLRFTEDLEQTKRSGEVDRSVCNNGNGKGTANLCQKNIENIESEANGEKSLQTSQNSEATDKGLIFTEDLEHTERSGEGDRSVCNNGNGKGTANLSQKNIENIESEANRDKSLQTSQNGEATDKGLRFTENLEHTERSVEGDRSVCNNGNGKGTANLSQKNIEDIESEANGEKSLQTRRNSEAIDKGLRFTEDLEHTQRSGGVRSVRNNVNGKGTPNLSQKNIEDIESEANGDKYPKRKLDFSTPNLELETEATENGVRCSEDLEYDRNGEGERSACKDGNGEGTSNFGQKSIDDIDKHRFTGPSVRNSSEIGRTQALRALPVSICGPEEDKVMSNNRRNIKLLDVLRMLSRNNDYDTTLEGKSILDVARSRGITFP